MDVLVCVKRVPSVGATVLLTDDGQEIDTRHLGFTIGPHEECAVEEAVRIVSRFGGRVTVLTAGPAEAEEQLRYTIAMGADDAVLVASGPRETDPEATASAITSAVRTLESESGRFDLILFGTESADAGHYQVGVRVACALGRPMVGGIKGVELDAGGSLVTLRREDAAGVDVYEVPLPAAVAVKEGLNLPRYPTIKGRLRARKATLRTLAPEVAPGGLRTVRLRQPHEEHEETIVLGHGAGAAAAVVDVLVGLGVV